MLVEVHHFLLSSDIAVVFHVQGNNVYVEIVLCISDKLLMPLNSLYRSFFTIV
jgi:hypothetical protein